MEGNKTWYESKTVWGALIAIGASLAQVAGVTIGAEVQADMADLAVTLVGAAGGVLAVYGRIVAGNAIR